MKKDPKNNPVLIAVLVLVLVGSLGKTLMLLIGGGPPSPAPPESGRVSGATPSATPGGSDQARGSEAMTPKISVTPASHFEIRDPFYHPSLKKQATGQTGHTAGGIAPNGAERQRISPSSGAGERVSSNSREGEKRPGLPLPPYPISAGRVKNLMTPGTYTVNSGTHAPRIRLAPMEVLPGLPTKGPPASQQTGQAPEKILSDTERIAGWRLQAVIRGGTQATAILNVNGEKPLSVHRGDWIRGLRVVQVRDKAIVLASPTGFWTLTQRSREETPLERAGTASGTAAKEAGLKSGPLEE